jgi:hypothetical protein
MFGVVVMNENTPYRCGNYYCCPDCEEYVAIVPAPNKYYEHLICNKCDRNWVHWFEEKEHVDKP